MIFWSGKGYLVALIFFASSLVSNAVTNTISGGDAYWEDHQWTFGVSLLVSAALCWQVSNSLRQQPGRNLVDVDTGERVVLEGDYHSFMFVPMHYWGPILLVFGIGAVVYDLAA